MLKANEHPLHEIKANDVLAMNARTNIVPALPEATESQTAEGRFLPTCKGCFVRQINACPGFGIKGDPENNRRAGTLPVASVVQVVPARRPILHQREISETVPVICSGWAAVSVSVPSGRRQIVSFLLAGDPASVNYLFEPCSGRAIDAVSQVSCRKLKRADLLEAIAKNPAWVGSLGKSLGEERERNDQLSLDLSRRSAEARIARVLCSLFDRMERRGQARDNTIEFPVRQQQIADATGLTAVHVCKVLGRFKAAKLIHLDGRKLGILNRKGLQDLIEWD
ncbi:MAG: Crp/Fnr family transcriptional regulator [Xanthobacteraceae bacterium]|nr:Crp/Fnr family transcriptional regulator [Xanthobacteraceae bacterium]QYK44167.1 MAG: Crp/Fnr family transcriptional regulator [Xanthobacteraceae bacterium]HMN51729.1 Crp/Fnr family transcriptional regulator [Xanthobacteraceae bacterium]